LENDAKDKLSQELFFFTKGTICDQKRFWSFNQITLAKGTAPSGKGITASILGSISEEGAIHISQKRRSKAASVLIKGRRIGSL
jgi:hypothetical protein